MPRGKSASETRELVYWALDKDRVSWMPAANVAIRVHCPKTSTENACRQLWKRGILERKKVGRVYFYRWKPEERRDIDPTIIRQEPTGWWFRFGKQRKWYGVFPTYDKAVDAAAYLQPAATHEIEFMETTCSNRETI